MTTPSANADTALAGFHECTQTWFSEAFDEPTTAQRKAWPSIAAGKSTLLLAPTGSGKTLAAFLAALDTLAFPAREQETPSRSGVDVLYVSPLKALGVDVDRNLRAPIAGLRNVAEREGVAFHTPSVAVRSGDTSQRERQQIARRPPEVLITTPESLYLMLTSNAASVLASVATVIIDEIHVMVPTKRGAHLFLSLERLERLRASFDPSAGPMQRIGLSATQRPLDEVARLLGGGEATADPDQPVVPRRVEVIDASEPKRLALRVDVPVEDMARLGDNPGHNNAGIVEGNAAMGSPFTSPTPPSIWPSIHPRLLELIRAHRSTMIFVNSRRLAERLASAINDLAAEEDSHAGEIALAHHGSIAKDKRAAIEDRLKRGQLPAIIATSSMELGVDMGAVDLVVQIESPPSIASGMQRIGRAGHSVGEVSRGVIFPKYRGDLLACSAATERMLAGQVEQSFFPRNPLDVLAQQIVAMVSREPIGVDDLYATIRGAAPFADLPRGAFESVLDLLAGRYPSDEFAELRPRVNWDRIEGVVSPRRGAQRLAVLNGGTIPDRGLYGVFLAGDGPDGSGGSRVGELDEEMVFETNAGDVFLLGASAWRVLDITRDRVIVAPAPGEPGRMPFWRGDAAGRPLEFGQAIGRLTRELGEQDDVRARDRLIDRHALDQQAADNLLRFLRDQQGATGELPSDRVVIIESFLDEIGDWRTCVLTPFGARVHAPWAIAVAARMREEGVGEVDMHWSDDGIVIRTPESDAPPTAEHLIPSAADVEDLVTRQLGSTAMFAARFRENAARALLLPRRRANGRTPLWMQRRKSADLLQVASRHPSFPILLETYRECLRDVFDLPGLTALLREVERRAVRIVSVESSAPSPFASSLLFDYTANFLYEGDAPLAERRAAALTLDHTQLRELLGGADLRELLDSETIEHVCLEVQRLDRPSVRGADDVHDLLLSQGALTLDEIHARCDAHAIDRSALKKLVSSLVEARRAVRVRVAGEEQYAAAEDAARLRDAIGAAPPSGLPTAFLESVADPLGDLVSRYARTHGPFLASDVARRLGLGEAAVLMTLERLSEAGRVVAGEFVHGARRQWCDASVLRQIKRRSLAKLRRQVEAAPAEALARFLPVWQGVTQPRRGPDGVLDVIEQLQGAPLVASSLEGEILPARVADYRPSDLDELFLAGEVSWRGIESLGLADGRITLHLAGQERFLTEPADPLDEHDPMADAIRRELRERGALRFEEIVSATGAFPNDLLDALWRLVWGGELTNDTLAPLRSLLQHNATRMRRGDGRRSRERPARRFRTRRLPRLRGSEGRWSLLTNQWSTTSTERQASLAAQLLDRYGVFTRSMASRELTPGGFASLYPVFKAMEETGKARRGYFVEGLGGAQFAYPGAEDMLRAPRTEAQPQTLVLAATDPANAYGAALPWPAQKSGRAGDSGTMRPQRAGGALVILVDGWLVGYLGKGGTKLMTFLASDEPDRSAHVDQLARALAGRAQARGPVMLEMIDGVAAHASPLAATFVDAGFVATSRGLLHRSG